MPPLEYCWLKIERAREHRDALAKYVADTFAVEANRSRVGGRFDRDSSEYIVYVSYTPDLGNFLSRCSILLGDAVHSLNSALDHLVYQLALLHTHGNIQKPSRIQFPLCDTADAFSDERKRRLGELDPTHIAKIERFQGYQPIDENLLIGLGTGHPLSKLRDLVSVEKHRLPIDIVVPPNSLDITHAQVSTAFALGAMQQFMQTGGPIVFERAKLDAVIMRYRLPTGSVPTDVEMAGYVGSKVAFDGDRLVLDALDKIAAAVEKVLREFQPVFRHA
jgi:hypothetical protein